MSEDQPPHYRDPELTDEVAMQAMMDAAIHAKKAVLHARHNMLAAGISDSHAMCLILDSFASCMAYVVTDKRICDPVPVIPSYGDRSVRVGS